MKRGLGFILIAAGILAVFAVGVYAIASPDSNPPVSSAVSHPASKILISVDGSTVNLDAAATNFNGTHTYSAVTSLSAGQHDASQIWVSVATGEMTLLQALQTKTTNKLQGNPNFNGYHSTSIPDPSHLATEIILASGEGSLQDAIDSGHFGCIPNCNYCFPDYGFGSGCTPMLCGDNGCGGSCGTCQSGYGCNTIPGDYGPYSYCYDLNPPPAPADPELSYTHSWNPGTASACPSTSCSGTWSRTVTCIRDGTNGATVVADSYCTVGTKPATSGTCSCVYTLHNCNQCVFVLLPDTLTKCIYPYGLGIQWTSCSTVGSTQWCIRVDNPPTYTSCGFSSDYGCDAICENHPTGYGQGGTD